MPSLSVDVLPVALNTTAFEPEKYFQTEDAQIRLVSNALENGDTAFLTDAIGIVAIAKIAEKTGLSRQALYAAFGPKGNPTISTVMKVLAVLGLTLEVKKAA